MLTVLASEHSADFLASLWGRVAEDLPEDEHLDGAGLCVHAATIPPGIPCAIVELPEPRGMTEAHFIAVVPVPGEGPGVGCRYITLEYTLDITADEPTPQTALCEWTEMGHLNFGGGPEPTLEAFVEAVGKMMAPKGGE